MRFKHAQKLRGVASAYRDREKEMDRLFKLACSPLFKNWFSSERFLARKWSELLEDGAAGVLSTDQFEDAKNRLTQTAASIQEAINREFEELTELLARKTSELNRRRIEQKQQRSAERLTRSLLSAFEILNQNSSSRSRTQSGNGTRIYNFRGRTIICNTTGVFVNCN